MPTTESPSIARYLLDHGNFQAQLVASTQRDTPQYSVRYEFPVTRTDDPIIKDVLRRLAKKLNNFGRTWTRADHSRGGYVVQTVGDVEELRSALVRYIGREGHPRAEVFYAWSEAACLLPGIARKLAEKQPKRALPRPKERTPARLAALDALRDANQKFPPAPLTDEAIKGILST